MQAVARKARSGELINDTYELKERLESTALCETYRATERGSGRAVRIKLLRPELALQSGAVESFLRAPRTLQAIRHPSFAQVIAIDTDATGIPFVVEESVEGESLARTMERFPQGMPYDAALAVITPLVDALAFAHARGVVHGQLDREHVVVTMVGRRAVPKLRAGAEESSAAGRASGVADRGRTQEASADVRALGGLLHEVLFGRPPVRNCAQVPGDRAAQLPAALVTLVEECLTDRITTVEAVRDALHAACAPKARVSVPNQRPTSAKPEPAKPAAAKVTTPAKPKSQPAKPVAVAKPAPAPAPQPVPAAAPVSAPAPAPAIDNVQLGLQATMIAESPSVPAGERPSAPVPRGSAPTVSSRPRRSDEPEAFPMVESAAPPPPAAPRPSEVATVADDPATAPDARPAPVEIKTLSDLASAFSPIEGADRVGQADHEAPKEELETKSKPPPSRDRKSAATVDRKAPLLSRKQLRDGNGSKPVARALSEEQLRAMRERAQQQPESRWSRLLSMLLFLLFAIALVFVVPLLCEPSMAKAKGLLGARAPLAMAGFAGLSVFALVRTWALQIEARPMLLRPVTLTLKVVTACVCVLAGGFFMPGGMLGPVAYGARMVLPWGAGGFYFFLAMYGVTRQLREAASQPVRAIAIALLYCMALVGGHRVLANTVLSGGGGAAVAANGAETPEPSLRDRVRTLRAVASGKPVPAAGAGADSLKGAAAALQVNDKVVERKEVGASEADDMTAVDALDDARKQKASALEGLRGTLQKVSR